MMTIRPAVTRGRSNFGWLDSRHTFSFGEYRDYEHMGLKTLRVINDDRVAPGAGFPSHPHRDMEILTWVISGALEHKDSLGTGSVIRAGDMQRMTAGSGIVHSEYNASKTEAVHFLQLWIHPREKGLAPGYAQQQFPEAERLNQLRVVASPDGREGSVAFQQEASIYATILEPNAVVERAFAPGRTGYLQMIAGSVEVNGQLVSAGDGVTISEEPNLRIVGKDKAEFLLFDL